MPWIDADARQSDEQSAMLRELRQSQIDDRAQALSKIGRALHDRRKKATSLFRGPDVKGHDQLFLRSEVVVRRAGCHSGLGGDIAHGRFVEAFLPKQLERSIDDALT